MTDGACKGDLEVYIGGHRMSLVAKSEIDTILEV